MPNSGIIELETGRIIRLRSLRQWEIYAGLLEGVPTAEGNHDIIQQLITHERDRPPPGEPYLIQPSKRLVPTPASDSHQTSVALPAIACVGHFDSSEPARDKDQDFSVLSVIWF